jgi:serine/threonine protein kinase
MVFDSHRLSMVFSHLNEENKEYEESDYMKIDMWSLGVIFYELFHKDGDLPYNLKLIG